MESEAKNLIHADYDLKPNVKNPVSVPAQTDRGSVKKKNLSDEVKFVLKV